MEWLLARPRLIWIGLGLVALVAFAYGLIKGLYF